MSTYRKARTGPLTSIRGRTHSRHSPVGPFHFHQRLSRIARLETVWMSATRSELTAGSTGSSRDRKRRFFHRLESSPPVPSAPGPVLRCSCGLDTNPMSQAHFTTEESAAPIRGRYRRARRTWFVNIALRGKHPGRVFLCAIMGVRIETIPNSCVEATSMSMSGANRTTFFTLSCSAMEERDT